jgi:inner membrane protein
MQLFAHAGIGWMLAEAGRGDRQFRQAVFLSALMPDVDSVSILFGLEAYGTYHHHATHSAAFVLLVSVVATAVCRGQRVKAFVFSLLAGLSHLLGDYLCTDWPMKLWYPFSSRDIVFDHALAFNNPLNHVIYFVCIAFIIYMSWRLKRTPFELISINMDRRICNLLCGEKTLSCGQCERPTNERCAQCGAPICVRHARLNLRFIPLCSKCCGARK